jgi:hypothetical protein
MCLDTEGCVEHTYTSEGVKSMHTPFIEKGKERERRKGKERKRKKFFFITLAA